jgi:dATP pyrophosphohydrolase
MTAPTRSSASVAWHPAVRLLVPSDLDDPIMANIVSATVEICVFRFREDHPEYLVLQRSPGEPIYPGMWQLVTGTIEDGERALTCALRELHEETGLQPERFWVVPHTSTFYSHRSDSVHVVPVFAAQVPSGALLRLSPEHSDALWLRKAEACARLVWPGQRQGLEIVHQYLVRGEEAGALLAVVLPPP